MPCSGRRGTRYTLRSHFDGVRALAFHPIEPCLVTVSEDHTLKLWNLTKTVPAKNGPVLSLATMSSGEQCFSGGIDSTIQWWNIPSSNVDPYDTYDPSVLAGSWAGHTDAMWGLAYSGIKNRLLSCSADGTVKLWNPTEKNPCICTFNTNKEHGIPTSVDFNGCDPAHMVASFNSGDVVVYDLETSQHALVPKGQGDGTSGRIISIRWWEVIHAHGGLNGRDQSGRDPNGFTRASGSKVTYTPDLIQTRDDILTVLISTACASPGHGIIASACGNLTVVCQDLPAAVFFEEAINIRPAFHPSPLPPLIGSQAHA
ncbi:striatin-3-like protein [Lates japonicus]|uniref:Striatin-3-like protein n=1 Tax=Lates japonicus TaxID=270547 RepID=A0AAD3NA82_LATJO|nr:striatin-3-like protein [Lates japonicus]